MIDKEIKEVIKNQGATDKEAKVYLSALELGQATVYELAEKSGVKRTTIYNFLDEMQNNGFITKSKENDKVIVVPENPKFLLEKANREVNKLEEVMPELKSIFNTSEGKPKIKFYQGLDGIKNIYEDVLENADEMRNIFDYDHMETTLNTQTMFGFPKRRAERGIKAYTIARAGKEAFNMKKKDEDRLRETRFIEEGVFETHITLYSNKTALISFVEPYVGVVIEDEKISKTMRSIFKIVWKSLK